MQFPERITAPFYASRYYRQRTYKLTVTHEITIGRSHTDPALNLITCKLRRQINLYGKYFLELYF
ncbi:hypothetical protein [Pedobacter frigoris]|uniref:Uncharacterized protein n=1 Tax=Pedobacter frigoris TaxID=2571272 RepID=A0A4U1CQC7_9SPHI|nr:hypothetical protein [Pedobacter frigoris]TKC09536.1 hypothetical protein FA047_05445 [Pedobacter frigoris]